MTRTYLLRLPDWAASKIEEIAAKRGQPYATVIKGLVCESLSENAPGAPSTRTSAPGSTRKV